MIRQREQEALSRIKNNPVKMAMIKNSLEGNKQTKHKEKSDKKGRGNKCHHSSEKARQIEKTRNGTSKYREHSPAVRSDISNVRDDEVERRNGRRRSNYDKYSDSVDESPRKVSQYGGSRYREQLPGHRSYPETGKNGGQDAVKGNHDKSEYKKYYTEDRHESQHKRRSVASRLSEEEQAARLREMQQDAELHEEQRWKRLKKAAEDDAQEATSWQF